jgi:hypothetical protein
MPDNIELDITDETVLLEAEGSVLPDANLCINVLPKRECAPRKAKTATLEKLKPRRAEGQEKETCSLAEHAFSCFSGTNIEILYKCALSDTDEKHRFDLTEDFGFIVTL